MYRWIVLAILPLWVACRQEQPVRQEGSEANVQYRISLLGELQAESLDASATESLKALNFTLSSGKNQHPKIELNHSKGKTLPATLLFRNTATQQKFVVSGATFEYNETKKAFELKDFGLGSHVPTDIKDSGDNAKAWQVFCLVGGSYDAGNGRLSFVSSGDIKPVQSGSTIDVEAIYMSEAWLPLDYTWDAQSQVGIFSLRPQSNKNSQKMKLKSQCMMLMCRISPNKLGREVKVQGFRVSTSALSFAGYYDLHNLGQGDLPTYTAEAGSGLKFFYTTEAESVAQNAHSGYYVCVAIPKIGATTSHLRISPMIGNSRSEAVETKFSDYKDKPIEPGAFVGINNIASGPKPLEHPIEGFFTTGYESREITRTGSGSASDISNNRGYTTDAGHYRTYAVPTIYQLAVLLPGMKGKNSFATGNFGRGILNYRLGRYYDTTKVDNEGSDTGKPEKERIFVWGNGNGYTEFDAVFEHTGRTGHNVASSAPSNTYFGIRFKGHGNTYLSAYKFVRRADDSIEITVRTLGPNRANTDMRTVKSQAFWEAPLAWDQRQWTRIIPRGVYWSSSTIERGKFGQMNGGLIRTKVHNVMKVFPNRSEDQILSSPDAAFVTNNERTWFLEDPTQQKNQDNYYILFSTDQKGRPFPGT